MATYHNTFIVHILTLIIYFDCLLAGRTSGSGSHWQINMKSLSLLFTSITVTLTRADFDLTMVSSAESVLSRELSQPFTPLTAVNTYINTGMPVTHNGTRLDMIMLYQNLFFTQMMAFPASINDLALYIKPGYYRVPGDENGIASENEATMRLVRPQVLWIRGGGG